MKRGKNMNNAELKIYLTSNTNMSEHDIDRHIADGIMVYSNDAEGFKVFVYDWTASLNDEEDAADAWKELEVVGDYRMEFYL